MADRNVFSIPVSRKRQASMKRRFIVFSSLLFMLILVFGSLAFIILMNQLVHENTSYELKKTVELERLRLEASVNGEIAIALKMADSPLIRHYFSNPGDPDLRSLAFEEFNAYCRTLTDRSIFWVNDIDKIFYAINHDPYKVDPDNPENYWYNMTLYNTEAYNFNINYNPDLNVTNLWINVPVFSNDNKPIGMVGAGINVTHFIAGIYSNYIENSPLFFFNSSGEITGAGDIDLVKNKVSIEQALGQTGNEIMAKTSKITSRDIHYFDITHKNGVGALGFIPELGWYIIAVHYFTGGEVLRTGMTILFIIMIFVILSIFAVFNVFLAKLLKPLHNIVREISRITIDWDLKQQSEITAQSEIETLGEFLNMTIIDPLTEIYNRRFFDGNMRKIIKQLSRTKGNLSLLMIDIDFFKKYNDTYGHDEGDKCLKEIATALSKSIIREEDFAARFGGEEFVVVLPNTDETGVKLIAEKLLNKVRECNIPHSQSSIADCVTISIGGTTCVVNYTQNEKDYVKHADNALYKSKQSGRNRYTFEEFTP